MDRALKTDREVGQARGNDMWPVRIKPSCNKDNVRAIGDT